MRYLRVNKELIPHTSQIVIDGVLYKFKFYYNREHDFFTLDLYKNNQLIVAGEKLTLGAPLFATIMHREVPQSTILIPLDLTETEDNITYDNFMTTVFIYLFDRDEVENATV